MKLFFQTLIFTLLVFRLSCSSPDSFFAANDSEVLRELFTINVGVMNLKKVGDLTAINPVDSESIVNNIKSELELIPAARLSRKSATIKAVKQFREASGGDEELLLYEEKGLFFADRITNQRIQKLVKEFRKDEKYSPIARRWFENIENPFYQLNISEPFDRVLLSNKEICRTVKVNDKTGIDLLFYGSIEKIDKLYIVSIYVYSAHEDRVVAELAFASTGENLTKNLNKELKRVIPRVFSVNYASLMINTNDEETGIYFGTDYAGKNNISLPYIVPGSYVITLKKSGFYNRVENISLKNFEKRELELKVEKVKKLQVVNFFIEPFGTKIYINSVYQGRTPFQKALPEGEYVISAKNELYQDYRYLFSINRISTEEMTIVYHLQTRNLDRFFKVRKYLYYSAFWNFTFSLAAVIPVTIFAYQYFYGYGVGEPNYIATQRALYGASAALITHTVLSVGWLFYALANYLLTLEKKDFIPILEFYKDEKGTEGLIIGGEFKLGKP